MRTKGKWEEDCGIDLLGKNDELMQIIVFSKEVNTHNVAHVFGLSEKELMANVRLVKKAPEMLEMLEELVSANAMHEGYHEKKLKAIQLIKEATEL